ncbi:RING/U-box superfamily protein [Perilla frutescens var. hirtella]|nr:RING/U-box superfamily protein [Perilla frutescens var. hirtella]KAH6816999.1 RING/U-box superfamily protein [Perilla frutescens var. frutescens]
MAEENANTMNLDLNLGPVDHNSSDGSEPPSGSYPNVAMNLEDWLDGPIHRPREGFRQRHRWRSLWRQLPIPPETRSLALELIGGNAPQTGEGSVAYEERPVEVEKICEHGTDSVEGEDESRKKDGGKSNGDEGSFFDCNICLDLAKDPVVTCCGHLFCWPCLYRWLHHHSDARECPVCKGEVTTKNVTPIYGRGNAVREPDLDSSLKIPLRPQARRIESWRQTIQRTATAFTIPMEEMIRRLGSAFDLNRELAQIQTRHSDGTRDSPERTNALLNRFLTSRGMRRERNPILPPDDVIDLTESSPPNYEMRDRDSRRLSSLLLRRSSSHRAASLSNLTSALNSAESLAAVESYFQSNPVERNPELPPPFDDRDSVSSIAAVIHSESQTVDNAIEIDSTVALSTSSSRRRNDASRISDVDSGDSRAPRRRRLN